MINFTKMHGLGNDYVFIDCTQNKNIISNPQSFSKKISNRNFGIGSDGLILIENSNVADFKMRIFNLDGSEAEMCGNGIRCVGKYVFEHNLTKKTTLEIETLAGIKKLKLEIHNNKVTYVTVDMGNYEIAKEININIDNKVFNIIPVSVGNPHAIIFTNTLLDSEIKNYAPKIECNNYFANKTNVEFVQVIKPNLIKIIVWERGSGFTLACGTGACACSIAAFEKKLTNKKITVELPGGHLQTYIDNANKKVFMSGDATTVFSGIYYN